MGSLRCSMRTIWREEGCIAQPLLNEIQRCIAVVHMLEVRPGEVCNIDLQAQPGHAGTQRAARQADTALDALLSAYLDAVARQVVKQPTDDVIVVAGPRERAMHQVDTEDAKCLRLRNGQTHSSREPNTFDAGQQGAIESWTGHAWTASGSASEGPAHLHKMCG